jgi:hypothetical protein
VELEKVTSGAGHDTLAGWISSNDATLFTTVLVLAIAMFLHGSLRQGDLARSEIVASNAALAENLEAIAVERDSSLRLLDDTRKSLRLTEEERNELQQQLLEKVAQLAELNTKLDALAAEKGVLEGERASLLSAQETLTEEKASLVEQHASMTESRDALETTNASLLQRLDLIAKQLEAKVEALAEIEQERDRLERQADELETIVTDLEQRLSNLDNLLATAHDDAQAAQVELQGKLERLQTELAGREATADEYLARLKRATALFEGLKVEKEKLQVELSRAEYQRRSELLVEARNNRALVGLSGRLERVAVLFDASGSMQAASNRSGNDRWQEAQEVAANWLQHLNVQKCVLVVFSSAVRTFPTDGSLADLRGKNGKANREVLFRQVHSLKPDGWTDTIGALRKAYQYDIDSILLFSDGAPTGPNSAEFDPVFARRVYDLCRAHRDIPIHTIGLGNYFDRNASTFLQSVAKITGGTFRGW